MELTNLYNEYKEMRQEYIVFIEGICQNILEVELNSDTTIKLKAALNNFENLNSTLMNLEVSDDDKQNLKDLQYLLLDSLMLSSELSYFYENNLKERFKMRAVNYINKLLRDQHSSAHIDGKCRVL